MVTMADQYKVIYNLSFGTIKDLNDLLTQIESRI